MTNTKTISDLPITEKQLQKHIRAFLEQMGWRVYQTWVSMHSPDGFPDLFAVRGPVFVAIELKTEKGKVTEAQQAWLDALSMLPGCAYAGVLRPSMWFRGELDEVLQ